MHSYAIIAAALLALAAFAVVPAAHAEVPRPEHPRPDFLRSDWLNLNGDWGFEIDADADGEKRGLPEGAALKQTIRVPFCPESRLSGVGHTDFMKDVWYRRTFGLPETMRGKRILLHFGAVDWHARVWVNGHAVGEHKGGYTQFTFDITESLNFDGENVLVVHAHDDTRSGNQATGKQAHSQNSEGCVYTRTTGIWQTVWLEAVGDSYLRRLDIRPDLSGGRVVVECGVGGVLKGASVRLRAFAGKTQVGEDTIAAGSHATPSVIKLAKVTPWAPGKPYLYDLTIDVLLNGKTVDTVRSYFGLRSLSIEGNRFLINGKPVFQRLILDQGFYPDGIYTAPTDADLRKDIELSIAAGFNGARLHQKVFEPRLLYWADKLGYIVWGEYPSWGLDLARHQALTDALNEWREVVERDRNHPSIVGWCPLNETGSSAGIAAAQVAFAITQSIDPTRPYLDTSGYVHFYPGTDVYDCHDYDQNPTSFAARYAAFSLTGMKAWNNFPNDPRSAYRGQPFFVSEYGGIHLKTDRSSGEAAWGYGQADLKEYLARYKGLTDVLLDNPNMFGFCYTQLTDVEQEQNGIYFYDRTQKHDPKLIRDINVRKAAYETQGPRVVHIDWRAICSTSRNAPQTWRYAFSKPEGAWTEPTYDDSGWQEGQGGFGTPGTPASVIGTVWNTSDVWLRRTFEVADTRCEIAALDIHHDEDAEVYLNGRLVAKFAGYGPGYFEFEATDAIRKALVKGRNTLAVHCRQTTGGQYIDVGVLFGAKRSVKR